MQEFDRAMQHLEETYGVSLLCYNIQVFPTPLDYWMLNYQIFIFFKYSVFLLLFFIYL